MFLSKATKVDDLLGSFIRLQDQLFDLALRKTEDAKRFDGEITTLQAERKDALEEARRADVAATKIQEFLA